MRGFLSRKTVAFGAMGVVLMASMPASAQTTSVKADGQLYVAGRMPPPKSPVDKRTPTSGDFVGANGAPRTQSDDPKPGVKSTYYERTIASWKDPLTLPQSREECVDWASGDWPWGGSWKTCIGWKVQWRFMYVEAKARVETPSPEDIGPAVEECLKTAVCIAAAAAIISGGSAALSAFSETLKICLSAKLKGPSVTAWTESHWGDWE